MFKPNTKNLKVLTPDGYKLFDGIQKVEKEQVEIVLDNGKILKCSKNHQLCIDLFKFKFKSAGELNIGDKIFGEDDFHEIQKINDIGKVELYDIVNVHDTLCYYTNGILSHNCQFLNTGVAAISDELFKSLESKSSPPRWSFDNGEYKIWKEPDPSRVYVQGVDTGEGVGENASVIQIMDITDVGQIEQVAEYWCNTISPQLYTKKVNEILTQWGKPLQMIERNNCGAQVVDGLLELYNYPFVVNWGVEKYNTIRKPKYAKAGVISHTNVKFSAVQNMRYWTNDIKAVILHSKDLVLELKNFVRQANGTWSANPGKLDDRVMAYVWALNILDPLCCQGFFEIIEYDVYGKPKRIQPNYDSYGQKSRLYTIQEIENGAEAVDYETAQIIDPVFGEGTYKSELTRWVDSAMRSRQQEIDMAMMQGWRPFIQETPREAQQNLNKGLGWNLLKM